MPLGKITIDRRNIRTMKKDIILAQRQGVKPVPLEKERISGEIEKERSQGEVERIKTEQIKQREKESRRGGEQREEIVQLEKAKKRQEEEKNRREAERKETERKETERKRLGILKIQQEQKEEEVKKGEAQKKEEELKQREKEVKQKEEEKKEEEPKYKKEDLLKEKEKIEGEKNKLRKALYDLALEKKPLEAQKELLLTNIKKTEEGFQIIASKEQEIEERQKLIEEKEEKAKTPREEKRIEGERWKIENKRQELEKKRWPLGKRLEGLDEQMNNIEAAVQKTEEKENGLEERKKMIFGKEEKIQLQLEKIRLKQELIGLKGIEDSLMAERNELLIETEKYKKSLSKILEEEIKVKEEKKLIEQEEKTTKILRERREAEKERWTVEEKRRGVETKKWDIEKTIQNIKSRLGQTEKRFQSVLGKKNEINDRIKEIDQKLGIIKPETEPIPEIKIKKEVPAVSLEPEFVKEEKKFPKSSPFPVEKSEKEAEKVKEIPVVIPEKTFKKEKPPFVEAGGIIENGQKKEEEERIKEAKKRIEALRKSEENRKIKKEEQIKRTEEKRKEQVEEQKKGKEQEMDEEEKRRQELLQRLRGDKKEVKKSFPQQTKPQEVVTVLPRKPSSRAKLWLRIIIVVVVVIILTGVSTFWYWFFVARKQPPATITCASDADCTAGQICNPEGACINAPPIAKCVRDADCLAGQICSPEEICVKKPPENVVPAALFLVDNTRTLEISNPEELRSLLSQTLNEWQNEGQFTRLVIKNSKDDTVIGLKEFFEGLLIRTPEDFYQKVDDSFTLFMYSQPQGNRLGFVTKIKNYEGLENLLRNQEPTMENDFQVFFALMGKEGAAVVPYFRDASNQQGYAGPNFRYQTINSQDLGILYLTSGDYFLFTSSWKSIEKAIKKLEITGVRLELTADLKLGDRGYEVKLLQSWLAQDATIYPRAIISGNFGALTEAAVVRLQEKYASEILAPQGLIKGNGIVDSYTRIKLNELYGESGIKPRMTELITGLKIGSYGEEVKLLQTWLAEDRQVYPQAIVSGYFGYLTHQALIRFQEKYMAEILTPQGLTKGTGVVDALTRKKLNELYAP